MNEDTLISSGGVVKSLGSGRVGGYGVFFSSANDPDLQKEFFHKGTDFDLEDRKSVPVFWCHGIDPVLKRRKLSRGIPSIDDTGIFVEARLSRSDEVSERILDMAEHDQLNWSSGSALHLIEKQFIGRVTKINYWPLTEFSLLPRTDAAEPRATVSVLKHLKTPGPFWELMSGDYEQQAVQIIAGLESHEKKALNERIRLELMDFSRMSGIPLKELGL